MINKTIVEKHIEMKQFKNEELASSEFSMLESVIKTVKDISEGRSKDPSTKVGACIYDNETGGLFLGYNGFPKGIPDKIEVWNSRERKNGNPSKYDLVIHAEVNAEHKAKISGVDFKNATLITTHITCKDCFKNVVLKNGIREVVFCSYDVKSITKSDREMMFNIVKSNDDLKFYHYEEGQLTEVKGFNE
jgi:deoxycytidylate deaminase